MRHRFAIFGLRALALVVTIGALLLASRVYAAVTTPQTMIYNARLLSSTGTPVTTAHAIRFSFWKSADYASSDTSGTGSINSASSNYGNWQEVQTVTPDSNGFFSVSLGSVTPIPAMDSFSAAALQNLSLQVEVKASSDPDTSYELLDPKPLDSAVDRSPILSVPFALNADRLDQRDLGTGSGSVPLLGSGGLLPKSEVPGGTASDVFTIDSDNSNTSAVTLKFGDTLNKTLQYDISNARFNFNDNVRIQGNLTVTGLVNGVDLASLASGAASPLRTTSGGGLHVNVAAGNVRINGTITNFAGSSALLPDNSVNYLFLTGTGFFIRTGGFPSGISYLPIATVTTAGGAVSAITDSRVLQSDNRENTVLTVLHPEYKDAAYEPDGSNNVGQLQVQHDDASVNNAYAWTSTRSSLQDYGITVRVTLPQQFTHWSSVPLTLHYKTAVADATKSRIDLQVLDTNGNPVTLSGATALTAASWTPQNVYFTGGAPTWTAGQTFLLKVTLSSKDQQTADIGDIELRYVDLEHQ